MSARLELVRSRILAALLLLFALPASAQILRLAELNTEQIRALDRARTVVLMPGGVLEEHGPYLPSFSDGYMNEWWTERIAEAIVARPGWTAVVFPMLPLGDGGANEIGGKFVFPGTYGLRVDTLRAVYMDLATELGEQGFRWIFVIQNHGAPLHHLALDQAGDYFIDTYGGAMVNLTGLDPKDAPPPPRLSEEIHEAGGLDIHAGLSETSRLLFLQPRLVSPRVAGAPPYAASTFPGLEEIARKPDWPGYFGTPHLATAAFGAAMMRHRADLYIRSALQILDGKAPRSFPRYATAALERQKASAAAALAYDESVRRKQAAWLRNDSLTLGETFTIDSKIVGETRRINVYRPPGTDGPLPVLYMPDGGVAEDFLHVAGLVQVSVGNGTMRPFLLVGIENTQRRRDMTGPTENAEDRKIAPVVGGSAAFRRFLREELMPEIEKRYRTTRERAIVGESLAGLFVVETLLVEPELFDTYIAVDPSLWWNDAKLLRAAARPAGKQLFVATSEEKEVVRLAQELLAKVGGHHEKMPEEKHSTIYHPAALKAFRKLFKPSA